MKRYKLAPHLGMLFIVAVVIPSIILSVIGIRSLSREEAYIEKQMEKAMLAEVIHFASLVEQELKNMQEELGRVINISGDKPEEVFGQFKERTSLVDVPFLLSSTREILWPRYGGKSDPREFSFLEHNRQFFSGEIPIPVYENIAVANKEQILNNQPGDKYLTQQAISEFQQHKEVRDKAYMQARQKGQQISERNIRLSPKQQSEQGREFYEQQSILISEPSRFNQIIAKGNSGIIPRLIEERLNLLFWKKAGDGRVAGCMLNQEKFKERIAGILPGIYSPARILTILDENGNPIIMPREERSRDWRRPFVAREISPILPRWEVVAYLTDPNALSAKAGAVTSIMWILIFILFISMVSGGALVLRSLYSEMALARHKTTFVANVSHELKTPLTSIRMFAEMLKERRQPDEEKREKYLALMVSEVERLTRLINRVLDFSSMEQGKKKYNMKEFDIVLLCRDVLEDQRLRLESNRFRVNFIAAASEIFVRIDEEAIKQAIINLLSNAEKYSDETKQIDLEVTPSQNVVFINIKDRGVGISPQDAKKIFKEFYRVDDTLTSKVRGTGLGLTIARQIIQDHGGDILYFPRDGGGSIFQIKLPTERG